jgi:hypothetical protein
MVHNNLLNYHRRYMISVIDSNVNITHTRGGKKVVLPFFPANTIIPVIISLHISRAHPLQSWDYFSTKSPPLSTLFSTFAWDAVCRSRKTLCWTSQLFTRAVFQPVVVRKSLECTLQGDQKDGNRRVLNRDRRGDEGEQSTSLIQLPPLCADRCAVWRYPWPSYSHSLF